MRFRVNSPDTVHETFDDEVVLLNLRTGNYYSLDAPATTLWNYIECGMDVEAIGEALAERHAAEAPPVRPIVHLFLQELERESLIVSENGATAASLPHHEASAQSFPVPQLQRYSDMQDLFLLDPIHEVQDSGWPRALEETPLPKSR